MIPVNEPLLDGNELAYVTDCVKTTWISSSGKYIEEFEKRWADYCGKKHGIAVANGTVALETAVAAFDFPEGGEIILPSFTIISCAAAVVKCGCRPVLVDSDPTTWCMDHSRLGDRINPRTVAVMPVHIYGHPVDMDPVRALARRHGIVVIEDAAEAHGAEVLVGRDTPSPRWLRCGGIGDASCFSFFANKIVTTGEGGMVLTDDDTLAARMRDHRNLYFHGKKKFFHERIGSNYRITNIQAAIGLAQLERIERFLARKREMARLYREGLRGLPLRLPAEEPWARNVYWMFAVTLEDAVRIDAPEFARRLDEKGVQTRPFFLGMHEQPVFHRMGLFIGERYPICERISRRGFYLPSGQSITDEQIAEVCRAVKAVFGELDG